MNSCVVVTSQTGCDVNWCIALGTFDLKMDPQKWKASTLEDFLKGMGLSKGKQYVQHLYTKVYTQAHTQVMIHTPG